MKNKEQMWSLYNKYYTDRQFEREEVFLALRDTYNVKSALYPGSYVHITPSFVFPITAYVDSDGKAKKFFANKDLVIDMIESRKLYSDEIEVAFKGQSYLQPLGFEESSFDLLISHYAGIISQPCKKYLKIGGLLLANNSHADAGVAYLDEDYKFIAVLNPNRKSVISTKGLERYFIPKKETSITKDELIKSGIGIGYTNTSSLYLFQRVR